MKNSLKSLYRKLSGITGGPNPPTEIKIDAMVTNVEIRSDRLTRITLLAEMLPNVDAICVAEQCFEDILSTYEVIFQIETSALISENIKDYFPWVVRHLEKKDVLIGTLFRNAKYTESDSRKWSVHLPKGFDHPLGEEGCRFLEAFFESVISEKFDFHPEYMEHDFSELIQWPQQAAKKKIPPIPIQAEVIPKDRQPKAKSYKGHKQPQGVIWGKMNPTLQPQSIGKLNQESGPVTLVGWVFSCNIRPVNQKMLVKFLLTDYTATVLCFAFMKPQEAIDFKNEYESAYLVVYATVGYDAQYEKDLVARVVGLQKTTPPPDIFDDASEKRIELHAHTKMSSKDAVCDVTALIAKAVEFGHPAIAITDHGVVQSFPDARNAMMKYRSQGTAIKIIYGMECYLSDDGITVAYSCENELMKDGFIALDIRTTGNDPTLDRLLEIAACCFVKDESNCYYCKDSFFKQIPASKGDFNSNYSEETLQLVAQFKDFAGDRPIVAEEAVSKISFLRTEGFRVKNEQSPRIKFFQSLIDTRKIKENLYDGNDSDTNSHFNEERHPIVEPNSDPTNYNPALLHQAYQCGRFLIRVLTEFKVETLEELNRLAGQITCRTTVMDPKNQYHCVLLAQNQIGLYCLYRLVSQSHLHYISRERPRIPRSLLEFFRTGLIIGSACESGEVFANVAIHYEEQGCEYQKALESLSQSLAFKAAGFYDYLEIQPIGNNQFFLRTSERRGEVIAARYRSEKDLENLNRLMAELARIQSIKLCATGDVHFLRPVDAVYREIIQEDAGYTDAKYQPPLYLRTTKEMMDEFSYLDSKTAFEAVVTNPQSIAARISEDIKPFPEGIFPPVIPTAALDIEKLTRDRALGLYGQAGTLPEIVANRIDLELKAIIGNGFAVMYYIAHHLVKKSNEDGYPVGSRGSVGSSLVATLCGITEVNPLPPHYYCPDCQYSCFFTEGEYLSGYDMPQDCCPLCGQKMGSDGQDIPFETFLGFEGEKQPDIDLNFSGEYQMRAHKYVEEMFGSDHTFRAGTIIGYAEKNAVAIAGKHCQNLEKPVTKAEITRLSQGIIGVKTTTSQHPGGVVVVPKDRDICEFTPVQCPADKTEQGKITTHFDFNSLHDTILKLDILGHDDPTMLKMLGDLTGIDILDIPLCDEQVMKLFISNESLRMRMPSSTNCATLGLPELGTSMARGMIEETKPASFYDLVQLMGLSHGKDVWKGNAQELIRSGICTLRDVIGCRDSIMTTLMHYRIESKDAFDIMEKVRKGKGLTDKQEKLMTDAGIPAWYIDSCKKIQYMFPKAHAAAYSISALRIAWFKVYYKTEYYCSYFTVRANEFDGRLMCRGYDHVKHYMEKLRSSYKSKEKITVRIDGKDEEMSSDKAKTLYSILELIEEMYCRGIEFLPISIYESDSVKFLKASEYRIRPPLNALPTVSAVTAENIVKTRKKNPKFLSREDFASRCGIGESLMKLLASQSCLNDLPETTQIDLFSLLA